MYNINSEEFEIEEFIERLLAMLAEKKYGDIRSITREMPPQDLAEIIDATPKESRLVLFRLLGKELAAETFVEMPPSLQRELTMDFKDSELSGLLSEMYLDDMVDLIEEMPAVVVKRILRQAKPEDRELVNQLLKYPKSSAGSVMTVEYVRLRPALQAGGHRFDPVHLHQTLVRELKVVKGKRNTYQVLMKMGS